MKKTVLFVLLDQWADWEAAYVSSALQMLAKEGYCTKTVALTKDSVESIGGIRAVVDYDISSIPKEYEAMILIGGLSWRSEAAKQIKPLAERCLADGRLLGGICDASGFLGVCGILNDIRHTSNDINDLKAWAGEAYTGEKNYIREPAVSDQRVITANGTAPIEFAREVLFGLEAAPAEKIMEWYNLHKLGLYNAPMPKM